ncbi:hypothetical protein KVR01_007331 [Diaporthe batatas]|uniref:uncharacterized protein n=1 Tax=Diaporthe batatas TaxID=748121 RepID=UPI001D04F190|nr:uncharacterized protein KVR01_007331 [Diaporthe batatas]KAG8162853.1 hypothetical protein KVR01_007331 [Diaporthe batatas]
MALPILTDEMTTDLLKRVDSLEQLVNKALTLAHAQSNPSTRHSRQRNTRTNLTISLSEFEEISKCLTQLKEDLKSAGEGRKLTQQRTRGIPTNETSLLADGGDSQRVGNEVSMGADSVFRRRDMGMELVESLRRYGTDFAGTIHISDLGHFDLASISKRLAQPDPEAYSSLFVRHLSSSKSGSSRLVLSEGEGLDFPDFSEFPQRPQGYEKSFENIIASPPQEPIFYYVGPPLAPDFNTLLSPGKLLELGEIPGVNTPYWHVGEKGSGTAFHYEDAAIRSCNVTITGFKLWILVDVSSNDDFESFVTSLEPSAAEQPRCGQWLRHLNILVSPEKLTEQGIRFDLILAGPGDMVVTAPHQYHAVLNLTACFAVAINFVLPEDPLLSPSLVCSKCGLYGLQHTAIEKIKRPVRRVLPERGQNQAYRSIAPFPEPVEVVMEPAGGLCRQDAASVETSIRDAGSGYSPNEDSDDSDADEDEAGTEAQLDDAISESTSEQNEDGEDITSDKQQGDSHRVAGSSSPSPSVDSSTPSPARPGLKRVASSREVSKRSKKRRSPPLENGSCFHMELRPAPASKASQVFKLLRSQCAIKQFCSLISTKRDSQLHRVFTSVQKSAARRLIAMGNVETSCRALKLINQYLFAVGLQRKRIGQRLDSSDKRKILMETGMSDNQYKVNKRDGEIFQKLCGSFDGILCFLPLEKCFEWQQSITDYMKMDDPEFEELQRLLQKDEVYFKNLCVAGKAFQQSLGGRDTYFAWETSNLNKPLHELPEANILQYIKPVRLQEDIFNATQHPNWPDPWAIPRTETPCYCSSRSCSCYDAKTSEAKLRIMLSPMKQLHLQAVSADPQAIVFKSKELLGFLTGKLVPPRTLDDQDWVFDTQKCQVDCRDESNEFKLLHHACQVHAVAELTEERVSGRIRLAVVARKDICDGEKITVCFKSGHKTCAECDGGL